MTEAEFQNQVYVVAKVHGWQISHFGMSQAPDGRWRTATRYDAKGFPDLILAHPGHGVLFRELKTNRGQLTAEQRTWIDLLYTAGADAAVWRPSDWPIIVASLKGKAKPSPSFSASSPWPDHL
jgi:hypothetical protein